MFARLLKRGHHRPALASSRRGRSAQSLVEFALLLPIMLILFGATTDFARGFSSWLELTSATRSASEYVATKASSLAEAQDDAQRIVCQAFAHTDTCASPTVTVSNFILMPGSDARVSRAQVTITTQFLFHTVVPYPFLSNSDWPLSSTSTFNILQGY